MAEPRWTCATRGLAARGLLAFGALLYAAPAFGQTERALILAVRDRCERALGVDEVQQAHCASSCADVALEVQKSALGAWVLEFWLHLAAMGVAAAVVVLLTRGLVRKNRRGEGFVSGRSEPFKRAVFVRSVLATVAVNALFLGITLGTAAPSLQRADWLQRELIRLRMNEHVRPGEAPTMTCRDLFSAAIEPNRAREFAQMQIDALRRLSEYEGMYSRVSLPGDGLTAERFNSQFTGEWRQRLPLVAEDVVKVVTMDPRPYSQNMLATLSDYPNWFALLARNASLRAQSTQPSRLHLYLLAGWTWQWLISMAVGYFAGVIYLGWLRRKAETAG